MPQADVRLPTLSAEEDEPHLVLAHGEAQLLHRHKDHKEQRDERGMLDSHDP